MVIGTVAASVALMALAGCSSGSSSSSGSSGNGSSSKVNAPKNGYLVYWDQNEEQDYYASATGQTAQLFSPWDANGQMCLLGDGTGRYVVGYNPTLPSQHNPGGALPTKQPPVGEQLVDRHGHFTGQALYVPGPYRIGGSGPGGDVPPNAKGEFNDQSTFTGCAVDSHHNVFAADLGTAQGSFPVPDTGRLIEWFAPSYKDYCIVDGPTSGGVGPHHVDGTGGLRQPGTMAVDTNGDLLLPEAGAPSGLGGSIVRFDHTSLPSSSAQCPGGLYPPSSLKTSVFIQGNSSMLPFPLGIARDPTCNCWAVDTTIGNPAIAWFDNAGNFLPSHPVIPGESIAQLASNPQGAYNPFGIAFAPDGTLYITDTHLVSKGGLSDVGPASFGGRILRVTFPNGQPTQPQAIAEGFDFPISTTICVIGQGICPYPDKATPPPRRGTAGEPTG
jgi:hypothetical protein